MPLGRSKKDCSWVWSDMAWKGLCPWSLGQRELAHISDSHTSQLLPKEVEGVPLRTKDPKGTGCSPREHHTGHTS